jgi:YesN/AraC family two-component response regulator
MLPFYQLSKKECSVYHNLNEFVYNSHIHKDIEILYMRAGQQKIHVNDEAYTVHTGEAAIIFPEQIHDYVREEVNAADEIIITCSPDFYRHFFSDMSNKIPVNPIIPKQCIHPDAVYALEHIKKWDSFNAHIGLAILIITRLLEFIELKQTPKLYVEDISYKLIAYINGNFTQPLTLESVAKTFSINKNYVSRIFSEKIKVNFRKYVGLVRAEYAANLLKTTDDKIATIAEYAGFESQRSFNRIFREIYGISPVEFRNNIEQYKRV